MALRGRSKWPPQRHGPRQRNRYREKAHIVVAGLILQRALDRYVLFPAEYGSCLQRVFEDETLHQPEGLLKYRHVLVENLKEIGLRSRVFQEQYPYQRIRFDRQRDYLITFGAGRVDVHVG